MLVYLDGEYVAEEEAKVSVGDRGFLFADGVYEVARVYGGRVFLMDAHLRRLTQGLRALQISFDGVAGLAAVADRLLDENELRGGDAIIYIQITRGVAPRAHAFPKVAKPTVYMFTRAFPQHPAAYFEEGVDAITVSDTRWTRCDIKTISLLPNVLANQQAKAANAFEALLIRDGVVLEGSHSNLFGVFAGRLRTYPACNLILAGITRTVVLEMAEELGIPADLAPILEDELFTADELFLSGTTTEVMPIARVDERRVGTGSPGPIARRLQQALRERI